MCVRACYANGSESTAVCFVSSRVETDQEWKRSWLPWACFPREVPFQQIFIARNITNLKKNVNTMGGKIQILWHIMFLSPLSIWSQLWDIRTQLCLWMYAWAKASGYLWPKCIFFLRKDAPFSIKREEKELSACISNTRPCWHLIGYHTLEKPDLHNPTFRKLHLVARYQEDPTSVLEKSGPT